MTSTPRPRQRISGPAELLDAIPYLLGFRPTESLVLVGLRSGTVRVTARLDLADTGQPDLLEQSVTAMHRGGADRFLAVVLDDRCRPPRPDPPEGSWPWSDVVVAVGDAVERVGAEFAEALLVARGRWWTYGCAVAACCPPGGTPVNGSPSAFAVASAFDGIVALPSRAALAETVAPLPDARRAALEPLIARAEHAAVAAERERRRSWFDRSLVRDLLRAAQVCSTAGWSPPDDATVARFALGLSTIEVRDEVWMAIDSGRVDGRALWVELGRRSPAPYDAAPMFLFGWASWRDGNGALAGMAADRALAGDPGYSAADLLLAALNQGVDPRSLPCLAGAGAPRVRGRSRRARPGGAVRTPR